MGKRLGTCRLISAQPLIWSTIRGFSIGSALWIFKVDIVVYIDIVFMKSIAVRKGGRLSSKLVKVVSGEPQISVFGQLLFLLYTSEMFPILENSWSVMPTNTLWWLLWHTQVHVRVTVAESQKRCPDKVSEMAWPLLDEIECEYDEGYDSLKVTHNAPTVTPINYWGSCAEGVWLSWHIASDIWFQDDFWQAFSLGFQSSFSKTKYLEEVLTSIPW